MTTRHLSQCRAAHAFAHKFVHDGCWEDLGSRGHGGIKGPYRLPGKIDFLATDQAGDALAAARGAYSRWLLCRGSTVRLKGSSPVGAGLAVFVPVQTIPSRRRWPVQSETSGPETGRGP
mgnify:FL=1